MKTIERKSRVGVLPLAIAICFSPALAVGATAGAANGPQGAPGSVPTTSSSGSAVSPVVASPQKVKKTSKHHQAVTKLSTVQVLGLRNSLESAELLKRLHTEITDSVVAQDIGKLPDNSVASALQRIPGVQVAPNGDGETTNVVVRGLPDVVTTLNGENIFSSNGRGFAFQNLPSTLVRSITVYKTSQANLLDGGIAGVVNMELWKPFDFNGFKFVGTIKAQHNLQGGKTYPIGSVLLSNTWDTRVGKVGALVDLGFMKTDYDYRDVWGDVPVLLKNPDTGIPERTANGDLIATPMDLGSNYQFADERRPAIAYTLQWAPTSNSQFWLTGLQDYDQYHELQPFFFTDYYTNPSGGHDTVTGLRLSHTCYANQFTGSPYEGQTVCDANGATWSGPSYAATSSQVHQDSGNDKDYVLGYKWHGGPWNVSTSVNRENSGYNTNTFIIDTFLRAPITTVWGGVQQNHQVWSLAGNPEVDPNNFYFNGLFQAWSHAAGNATAWRGDATYHVNSSFLKQVQFGLRYARHRAVALGSTNISTPPPWGLGAYPEAPNADGQVALHFPSGYFCRIPSTPALGPWLTGCYNTLSQNEGSLRKMYGLPPGPPADDPGSTFNILEQDEDAYVQLQFQHTLFGMQYQMFVGMRAERVLRDLDAFSFDTHTGVYTPLAKHTLGNSYLPNFAFNLNLTNDLLLRLDYAKTITYPSFGSLNPSIFLDPGTVNRQGFASSGNADLSPVESHNYDMSLEWYFNRSGYVSADAFYRKIHGFLQNFVTDVTIGGLPFQLSSPQSAGGGFLDGFELAYQQFFTFLPGWWRGFGLQLNYTRINGDTSSPQFIGGPVVKSPLAGVSKNNGNAVLMYELHNLSVRLAWDYRSRFISGFNQPNVAGVFNEVEVPNELDLGIQYNVNRHLALDFDAVNLTGANYLSFWGSGNSRPRNINYTGRTVSLGARFKF